jgi:hypothetical protein
MRLLEYLRATLGGRPTTTHPIVLTLSTLGLLLAPTYLEAQAPTLPAGSEVGIRKAAPSTGEAWLVGSGGPWSAVELIELTADSVRYMADGAPKVLPLDGLDIGLRGDRRWAGLALGGGAGAIAGAIIGAAINPGDEFVRYDPDVQCVGILGPCSGGRGRVATRQINSPTDDVVGGAIMGALAGGALGWAIGKSINRWEAIPLDRLIVSPSTVSVVIGVP